MKRLLIALLALCLLTGLCAGCATDPAESSAPDANSEAASEVTGDIGGDESTGDAETESSDDGLLLGTTTGSDTATTDGTTAGGNSNNTTKKNASTTKGNGKTTHTIVTQKTITRPSNAPTSPSTTTKQEIVLPQYDIDYSKKLTVLIDWDPSSSWVQGWEQAFRVCYDPDKEIQIEYKVATPGMRASKLAVWKSANQTPDVTYCKPEEAWPTLVNKGLTQPIDGYVDLSTGFWESDKAIMDSLKINGKNHVAVSSAYGYGAVVYNPKTMKNAGLTDPRDLFYEGQWTYDKFEEYCKKLTRVNATDPAKSTYGAYFAYYEPFLFSGGLDLIGYKDGKWVSNLNNKAIVDNIEYLRLLGDTGNKYTLTDSSDKTAIRQMTISGQLGFYVTAESPGLEFTGDELYRDVLRYVPIPHNTALSDTYYHGGVIDGWMLLNGAKNPVAGMAYASAVRAINVLDVDTTTEEDKDETPENNDAQIYFSSYAHTQLTYTVMHFRRLSGSIMYWDIYGGPIFEGAAWSTTVAHWEPMIEEALIKL